MREQGYGEEDDVGPGATSASKGRRRSERRSLICSELALPNELIAADKQGACPLAEEESTGAEGDECREEGEDRVILIVQRYVVKFCRRGDLSFRGSTVG